MRLWTGTLLLTLCLAALPAAALPTAAGYSVTTIDAGATTTGGVVAVGETVFVGIGSFGAPQSVVRIDPDGTVTTLATDFGSLAGMTYDAVNERLLVGDNGLEISGVTGDTVYEIQNPFSDPGSPPAASTLELAPAGSIDGVADVILDPSDPSGQTLLVSDGELPALPAPQGGQLWSLDAIGGTTAVLQQGLGFSAGLATDGTTLFIGQADLVTLEGLISSVLATDLTATPSLLASALPGQFDLVFASDGSLLSTSGSEILSVDPVTGAATGFAAGFGFATGIDEEDGVVYALDFGATTVFRFTPIPEPGAGSLLAAGLALLALGRGPRAGRHEQLEGKGGR